MPNINQLFLLATLGIFLVCGPVSGAVAAEDVPEAQGESVDSARSADNAPVTSLVWFEHSATFRMRPEFLVGGDLGNSSSGVPQPLSNTSLNGHVSDSDLLSWASIRLRYETTIHVGQPWSIHMGLDALDNLVLGSTHVNAGGQFDEGLWRESQGSPSAGINSFSDALEIRYAYARWKLLFLDLRAGRIPDQRGLGVWRQDGRCIDCDYGTYVDGVHLGMDLFGFRIEGGWEASSTGATSELPGLAGQHTNLDIGDDVNTWTVSFGRNGLTAGEDPTSTLTPEEQGAWIFDWAVYAAISSQSMDTAAQDLSVLGPGCDPIYEGANGLVALPYDCWRSIPRGADIYRPGAWLRARWRPDPLSSLRLEFEFSTLLGQLDHTQRDGALEDTAKTLRGFGGAFEAHYRWDRLQTGLDFGFATGDDRDFLGVLDGQNILVADDGLYLDDVADNVRTNRTVTSFWFHRDYHVDLILFRQVLGAVTNAVYLRPWISYDLLDADSFKLGARFDLLYAAAANPAGTPGDGNHWGVEMDASTWMDMPHGFRLALHTGVLVPLDALDDRLTGESPDPVFAFRGLLTWRY